MRKFNHDVKKKTYLTFFFLVKLKCFFEIPEISFTF